MCLQDATAAGASKVKHFPVVAVLGGSSLFETDVPGDEHVNISPAIQTGEEICFFAMPAGQENKLAAKCRPVCTSLQVGTSDFILVPRSCAQSCS